MKDVDKLQVLGLTSRCRCPPARATRARRLLRCRSPSGCRHDFRVKMWGTSSPDDKLTGDLGNVIESTQIGGRRLVRLMAGSLSPGNFGLLQQYRHKADIPRCL